MQNAQRAEIQAVPADLFITDRLERRMPAKADFLKEKLALQDLAARMADRSEEVLPRFVDLAMEMTGGVSAGLSLYEPDPAPGVFRWRFLRGVLSPFEHATTPRDFSPCGVTLDQNAPVLSLHPERYYSWISDANIVVPEVLLVPLRLGEANLGGTLWIVSDREGHFDSGHARVLTELAEFVAIALRMLSTERRLKESLEEQEMLTKEMTHRLKNVFAVTSAVIRMSEKAAETPAEMSRLLGGRLNALAEANALVRPHSSDGNAAEAAELAMLVEKILKPHAISGTRKLFTASGPEVSIGERAINGLALVLHELATNAVKYGALHAETGTIEIGWRVDDGRLLLTWCESGGPAIAGPPATTGFGTRLAQTTIVRQFQGEIHYDWRPGGLVVRLDIPTKNLVG